jgi:hypothetical protein
MKQPEGEREQLQLSNDVQVQLKLGALTLTQQTALMTPVLTGSI